MRTKETYDGVNVFSLLRNAHDGIRGCIRSVQEATHEMMDELINPKPMKKHMAIEEDEEYSSAFQVPAIRRVSVDEMLMARSEPDEENLIERKMSLGQIHAMKQKQLSSIMNAPYLAEVERQSSEGRQRRGRTSSSIESVFSSGSKNNGILMARQLSGGFDELDQVSQEQIADFHVPHLGQPEVEDDFLETAQNPQWTPSMGRQFTEGFDAFQEGLQDLHEAAPVTRAPVIANPFGEDPFGEDPDFGDFDAFQQVEPRPTVAMQSSLVHSCRIGIQFQTRRRERV